MYSDNEFVKKRQELASFNSVDGQFTYEPDISQPLPYIYFEFLIPASICGRHKVNPKKVALSSWLVMKTNTLKSLKEWVLLVRNKLQSIQKLISSNLGVFFCSKIQKYIPTINSRLPAERLHLSRLGFIPKASRKIPK